MTASILVHGGAGPMRSMTPQREAQYRDGLAAAARAGRDVLARGHSALDAVLAANRSMETAGVFNAGLGSCLDLDGRFSLDAALMSGHDRSAGAVAALTASYHPTDVCADLIREGRHVILAGPGADRRARRLNLPELPPPSEHQRATHRRLRSRDTLTAEDTATVGRPDEDASDTVGAVAVDARGRVAASVSTGGMWLKAPGRVGDSAVVGAGLFACDQLGAACSTTGIGERLIRSLTAFLACQHASHHGARRGARAALLDLDQRFGPDSGGLILLDRHGNLGLAFNTHGMGRALARVGDPHVPVAVWADDPFPEN